MSGVEWAEWRIFVPRLGDGGGERRRKGVRTFTRGFLRSVSSSILLFFLLCFALVVWFGLEDQGRNDNNWGSAMGQAE